MSAIEITTATARRFILGRHGLWPGRRWSGRAGVDSAIRTSESIQVDTINAVARSHDIALWSRVAGYHPSHLDALLYTERTFFDYGWICMIYPADEILAWRSVMARTAALEDNAKPHSDLCDFVLGEIAARGPLSSRDFTGRVRVRGGFDTVKDTALAIYWLWMAGEIETHSRRGFDRVYALAERIPCPAGPISIEAAEEILFWKAMRDVGLATSAEWGRRASAVVHRKLSAAESRDWMQRMVREGAVQEVRVESTQASRYVPTDAIPLLQDLECGKVPSEWTPIGATTDVEANILAPLDNVIWDRKRTDDIFGFDYVWEVYKPAAKRRWGYYTLPILVGDRFIGRFAPRLSRTTQVLSIEGFWLEPETQMTDALVSSILCGLARFAQFHEAATVRVGPAVDRELAGILDIDPALPVS